MRAQARYRKLGARLRTLSSLGLLLLGSACAARASVAVLLEEPYGDLGMVDPAGHMAVYLDHICAASPTRLRSCEAGELGVVLSRYDGIGNVGWVAMPLIPYLYAVDKAEDIPAAVSSADVTRLRDAYRRTHLEELAPDLPGGQAPEGNWYELVGSAFDRSLYGFQVKTTAEQDAALIAQLNDHGNKDNYNGLFRNCADFARVTINAFYPHAIRRNYIADLGLTSPKAVARGLAHYAAKHPEIGLQAYVVSQISGDAPRSFPAQVLTEGIIKHFGVPLLMVSPVTTAVLATMYVSHGRFAEPKAAPVLNLRTGLVMAGAINRNAALLPARLDAGTTVASVAQAPQGGTPHVVTVAMPVPDGAGAKATPAVSTLASARFVTGAPQ